MATRYIYLNDNLNNKLREEHNASALIVRLLNDYYNSKIKTPKIDPEEELNMVELKKVEILNKLEEEKATIKNKIEIKNKEIEYEEKRREKKKEEYDEQKNRIKEIFLDETGFEMSEEDIEEYFRQGENIYRFIIKKGYSKGPEDELELDN